jgi:hypothetical protein
MIHTVRGITSDVLPHPDTIQSSGHSEAHYSPDMWRLEYHCNRYLQNVSDTALCERYQDLLRNIDCLVYPCRHTIPISSFVSSWYWYRKEFQTRMEFALREIEPPFEQPINQCGDLGHGTSRQKTASDQAKFLYRYDCEEYLQQWVDGRVRISAASTMVKDELDSARFDEEQVKHRFTPSEYTRITRTEGRRVSAIGDVRWTCHAPDYYLLCLSCKGDRRIAKAFGKDACLRISNIDELGRRLEVATHRLLPNWRLHHGPVEYYDPYERTPKQHVSASISKDFRFAYQQEYRFAWLSEEDVSTKYRFLETGSLADIAEFFVT